jgi:hypothetical protein
MTGVASKFPMNIRLFKHLSLLKESFKGLKLRIIHDRRGLRREAGFIHADREPR